MVSPCAHTLEDTMKKPTTTTTTVVDNGTFETKTEAETGMKSMKVCTEKQASHCGCPVAIPDGGRAFLSLQITDRPIAGATRARGQSAAG